MLTITPEARKVIDYFKNSHEHLVLVVGSGCCDGPVPQLLPEEEYIEAQNVIVHEEEALRVIFHAPLTYSKECRYIIDVEHDVLNDGFSLESKLDSQFKMEMKGLR